MILSFRHKGLKLFFETGDTRGINAQHVSKLQNILGTLDQAKEIGDMNKPAYGLHSLKGEWQNRWSVKVSGAWRITFEFNNGDAEIVDYQQYH